MMIRLHLKLNSSKYQNNFKYLILFSNYVFIYFVLEEFTHYGAHTEVREQFEELGFCPSTLWIREMKLRMSGLTASAFSC